MTKKEDGDATLFVRLQSRKLGINYKMATPLVANIREWNDNYGDMKKWRKYSRENTSFCKKVDAIQEELDNTLDREMPITKEEMRQIIENIAYAEAKEAENKRKEEKAREEAEKNRMTLNKYIDLYLKQIATGGRQTARGRNFAPSSVKSIKMAMTRFKEFQKAMKREYDFNDINMDFYYAYNAFLKKKNYNINTCGKCIKELKTVIAAAQSEGHHSNQIWRDNRFKGNRVEVDSIFLTREELDKIMAVDMSKFSPAHEQARDIFMIGVWTAQRVSDYNYIQKEDFNTLVKNVLREEDDPDHPGEKKAWVERQEITFLNIRQQKTGAKVAIPCNSALKAILEKYDYQVPHLPDQVINRYIKDIAQAAGLTDLVEIESTKGGTPKTEKIEKYKLIHTHTARRTGATLMYLDGIDIYDIMKITGHTSPKMLKKYIRADSLQVVEKLTDKYDYFK
jgi:integrase